MVLLWIWTNPSLVVSRSVDLRDEVFFMTDASTDMGTDASALEHPFVTLDVSLDAHVIPGRGKRVDCLLPVVCAAQEDTIEALVTSVVCQRCVWKMSSPVVGISLSNRSTIARIVLGWAEVPTGGDNEDAVVIVCFERSVLKLTRAVTIL